MAKQSLSDAVKHLENMRDEGFLTNEQFMREMRELMRRAETEDLPPVTESVRQAGSAGLGDMVDHSAPEAFDDGHYNPLDPLGEIGKLELEDAPAPQPAPAKAPEPAPMRKPVAEAGRVIVSGKVPWDDQGHARVSLDAKRKEEEEDSPQVEDKNKLNPVERERLARMASKTIETLNKKKNPQLAMLLSLLWPGLGQAYIGQTAVGMLLMLVGGAGWMGLWFEEYWVLYILPGLGLLSGAMAHKTALFNNSYIDRKQKASEASQRRESNLNVEKSIRQHGAKPAVRNH